METLNIVIAARIEELRKERGIKTRNKLATLSGIDHTTLDNLIKGKSSDPKLSTMYKIVTGGLGMRMAEFYDFEEMDDIGKIKND